MAAWLLRHACHPASLMHLPQICCSFGVDVLEALAASCTQLAAAWTPRAAFNLTCDVVVASLLLVLHGATLMSQVGAGGFEKVPLCPPNFPSARAPVMADLPASAPRGERALVHLTAGAPASAVLPDQAMVFGVAMNSKKNNTLVALLIAANFTEIKGAIAHAVQWFGLLEVQRSVLGSLVLSTWQRVAAAAARPLQAAHKLLLCPSLPGTVLKRFDATKLYTLACQVGAGHASDCSVCHALSPS